MKRSRACLSNLNELTDFMQPGPASLNPGPPIVLVDISNRGLAGLRTGKVGGKAVFKPVSKLAGQPALSVKLYGSEANQDDAQVGIKRLNFDARPEASKAGVDNMDTTDASNPQYIVPCLQGIHLHDREAEGLNHTSPSCMSEQTDINAMRRAIVIDWLVGVHRALKLMPETLYLTVNLIDHFLEKVQIMRSHLFPTKNFVLVGVTAMFLASKYEHVRHDRTTNMASKYECRDFVDISNKVYTQVRHPRHPYTRDDILKMEDQMRAKLNFQPTEPNAFFGQGMERFVKRFAEVAGIATTPRSTTELLANYLVELTLQDYKMHKYLPSTICASAVYLALKTRGKTPWTPDLVKDSTFKEADLQACVRDIHELHDKAPTDSLQAVRNKYALVKHGNVSRIAPAHLGW